MIFECVPIDELAAFDYVDDIAGVGDIFNKYKFRANGWVTGTTKPEWAYLIGYKTFEMGTSSDPFDPPIFAPDTLLRLVPAQKK